MLEAQAQLMPGNIAEHGDSPLLPQIARAQSGHSLDFPRQMKLGFISAFICDLDKAEARFPHELHRLPGSKGPQIADWRNPKMFAEG